MKSAKVKKALLAGLSLALVAVMAVAGTVAYLQDNSEDVINTFSTNNVNVDLTETTGNDYNIIPGTSQDKDPKVTVDNSVDAYVFLVVTDNTDGAVTYSIENGWLPLVTTDDDGESITIDGVYYRTVEADDAAEKSFYVLEGNKVSYDAALTNEDMPDGPATLTFKAYAIQTINGNDEDGYSTFAPDEAYYLVRYGNSGIAVVETVDELTGAIENGDVAILNGDISIETPIPLSESEVEESSSDTVIDLNGWKLTSTTSERTYLTDGNSLTIENGTLVYECDDVVFDVKTGSSVTLENIKMTTGGAALFPQGDAAEVNVINSTITTTDAYCIATNAGKADNYNVVINLENSVLKVENQYGPTVLINVPGMLNIDNCVISGERIAVAVRGGTASITNSTLITTGNAEILDELGGEDTYFTSGVWGTGNMLPQASLLLGNRSTSYQYPTVCTLENVVLTAYSSGKTAYVYGNATEELGVTLTYDDASDLGNVIYGGGYAVINGVVQGN